MTPSRRGASPPTLLIVDAGPGAEHLERHVVPWMARVARTHGTFDVRMAPAHVVLRPDRREPSGNAATWTAAVAAADAVLFATTNDDAGLLALLLDLAGRRDHGWRLKPVAIAHPAGPAGDRVADLLEAALRDLHARPLDDRVRWADPAQALRAGADATEAEAHAALVQALDGLYRAHQTLRAFRPVEPVAAAQGE